MHTSTIHRYSEFREITEFNWTTEKGFISEDEYGNPKTMLAYSGYKIGIVPKLINNTWKMSFGFINENEDCMDANQAKKMCDALNHTRMIKKLKEEYNVDDKNRDERKVN